jgi:ABC-type Zn uptake system ZnuABC Zn-binding protein ZnuA
MKKFVIAVVGWVAMQGLAWAEPLKIVTTTEDLAAIAREVGGSLVEVHSLTRGSQDPHHLEARPSLILKASYADLFIEVGADLEVGWVPVLLVAARNPAIQPGAPGFLDASGAIELLEVPVGQVNRSEGDVHPMGNPHYHLDPENGKRIAGEIAERLARLRPGEAAQFDANRTAFVGRLNDAIGRWTAALQPYRGARLVTYHKSWSYFAHRFGLQVAGYVEPKPGIPPSAAHLDQLMQLIKQQKVGVVLMEPYFSRSVPELLVRETGARLLVLPPSVGGAKGITTYIGLFDALVGELATALSTGA